ncbi:MAG: ABC transporter permease [SAR324 cluster bacterium]|nr:ABC transporter permease [SAR324 cluster bacterium]MCZ6559103.1 ABC transporter permease [SAR324 cluster bacterium]
MAYMMRRLLWTLPIMLGVLTLVFFLIHMIPGDPVELMLGEYALPADRELMREQLGLNRPIPLQYAEYLKNTLSGDLGQSLPNRRPVTAMILERLPATLELMLGAMAVAVGLALPLGILAAVYHGRWLDQAASVFAVLGVAIPNFWLGPLLVLVFSIQFDWLPVNERGGLEHLVLPAITLGTSLAALLSRMTRTSLVEVLGEDYIRAARAKGLNRRRVILVHALRNALIPIITIAGLQIGVLLSGAIITESIFDWPGIGSLLLEGIYQRDFPLVQGCVLFIATSYVLINLATDIIYGWVDPRIRQS